MALIPFAYHQRSLRERKVTTLASAIGIALVVFVFATVLMLAHGIERTLMQTGHPQNTITMRKGATAEIQSILSRDIVQIVGAMPEVVRDEKGPLVSPELVVLLVLDRRDGAGGSNVTVRGVGSRAMTVHPEAKLASGRMFEHGKGEVVVGKKLADRFKGTRIGEEVKLGKQTWRVVGVLEANGSAFESEIWGDAEDLMPSFQRTGFSSISARVLPQNYDTFKRRAEADQRLAVNVRTEPQYYKEQSKNTVAFVRYLGLFVAVVFSLGAMIGAMITMYAQVASRVREIGTLRAMGFQRTAIVIGFMLESLLLALVGGVVGVALASFMELATFSTMNFASFSEIVFRFELSAPIIIGSLVFAAFIGMGGGLAPSMRAAKMKLVDVIRA